LSRIFQSIFIEISDGRNWNVEPSSGGNPW
jgi:hypothetical protein